MVLQVIPTSIHGVIDYTTAGALLAAPTLLGLEPGSPAALVPRVQGATVTLYSLLTDYELGVAPVLPMRAHLVLDALGGAVLAASPWLFGFARGPRRAWLPHVVLGMGELAVTLLTRPRRGSG